MKRLLVLFAVLVPLSLFIAGCGDTGGSSEKKSGGMPTADQKRQMREMRKKGGHVPPPPAQGEETPGEAPKK